MDHSASGFDAFISYSHAADGQLAPAIQSGLERVTRPWYRARAFRLFRDQTNLSVNPNLWDAIERALGRSKWFILFASVSSAKSRWVSKEVAWWLTNRSAESLIMVLTDGEIVWSNADSGFDLVQTTALPEQLLKAYTKEPLHIDMRWAKDPAQLIPGSVRFRTALIDIAATLRGVSKDQIDGEAVRTIRRNRYWASGALLSLAMATVWAFYSRQQAVKESLRNSLELDARQVVAIADTKRQADALPLAISVASRSLRKLGSASNAVVSALRFGIEAARETLRFDAGGQVIALTFDADGHHLIGILRDNIVRRWMPDGRQMVFELQDGTALDLDDNRPLPLQFSPSRAAILARIKGGEWRVWGMDGKDLLGGRAIDARALDVSASLSQMYVADHHGRLIAYDLQNQRQSVIGSVLHSEVRSLHAGPDGGSVTVVFDDGKAVIFRRPRLRPVALSSACREATGIAKHGRLLISVGCGLANISNLGKVTDFVGTHSDLALLEELAVSGSDMFAVTHERDDRVSVFNLEGMPAMLPLMGAERPSIALSPDGLRLAMGGYLDSSVRLFDLSQRSSRFPLGMTNQWTISALDVCTDRSEVFWGTQEGSLLSLRYLEQQPNAIKWPATSNYVENIKCIKSRGVVAEYRDDRQQLAYINAPGTLKNLRTKDGEAREGLAYDPTTSTVFGLSSRSLQRWTIKDGASALALDSLELPWPENNWHTMLVGDGGHVLVLGSYDGEIAALDPRSGAPIFNPKKVFWSNVWSLSRDVQDQGFSAGGAGTAVATFDWAGNERDTFQVDRFQFAASSSFDTSTGLIAFATTAGSVLVRDLKGNAIGPPIRNVSTRNIVHVRITPDHYLIVGDPDYGISIHDFDAVRLLSLACKLLEQRKIPTTVSTDVINIAAVEACNPVP